MKVLVTGADGFVGTHLVRALRDRGDTVEACGGPGGAGQLEIRDRVAVEIRVREVRPERVIHLAGVSSVARSHDEPSATIEVNVLGAAHLLDAVRRHASGARVLLVGSGEAYGAVRQGHRASETDPERPLSPYAASKVAAEVLARQMSAAYGLQVVLARPFNHLGPGQSAGFVVPSFANQLIQIADGQAAPVISVGDLSPVRDFSHVLDVIDGYLLLLEQGRPGEIYNLCSGDGHSIGGLLHELQRLVGTRAEVRVDPQRLRPVEIPWLVGDPSRAESLGWRRRRTVGDALRDLIESLRGARPSVTDSASSSTQ